MTLNHAFRFSRLQRTLTIYSCLRRHPYHAPVTIPKLRPLGITRPMPKKFKVLPFWLFPRTTILQAPLIRSLECRPVDSALPLRRPALCSRPTFAGKRLLYNGRHLHRSSQAARVRLFTLPLYSASSSTPVRPSLVDVCSILTQRRVRNSGRGSSIL